MYLSVMLGQLCITLGIVCLLLSLLYKHAIKRNQRLSKQYISMVSTYSDMVKQAKTECSLLSKKLLLQQHPQPEQQPQRRQPSPPLLNSKVETAENITTAEQIKVNKQKTNLKHPSKFSQLSIMTPSFSPPYSLDDAHASSNMSISSDPYIGADKLLDQLQQQFANSSASVN